MKKPMHIAHFTNTYKPNINGVVRSVDTFRESFTRQGHNVFIFAQDTGNYEDTEPFIFRYPAIDIPMFDYSLAFPVSTFVDKLLPSLKLDVIHSNHPILLGDAAADRAKKLNLPLVFTFHTRYDEYTQAVPLNKAFVEGIVTDGLARYLRKCQHIVTPSDSIKNMLEEFGGVTERVTTIPTGIDLAPYQTADGESLRRENGWSDEKILISIGRLAKEKNWNTLLSAVALVMKKHPKVRLVLLGDGPQRSDLEKHAASLGIADKVTFTGLVPFEQVPGYLKAADMFCFASVTETQGLVTMEALAAGLPVVAVDATGTSDEITDGKEGLLTENDSSALGNAINSVLDNPSLMAQLEEGARQKAQSFDMMARADQMLDVYQQAIEDKKAERYIKVDFKQNK